MKVLARIAGLLGALLALGGIPGLVVSWLRDSAHPWTDWPSAIGIGDLTWGRLCSLSQACILVGVALIVFSLSRASARVTTVFGICLASLGFAGVAVLLPAMEPVMHLRGHADLNDLPRSEVLWMVKWVSTYYVFEIISLAGLLLLAVRLWTALAGGLRQRAIRVNR